MAGSQGPSPSGGAGVHSFLWATGEILGDLLPGQVLGKGPDPLPLHPLCTQLPLSPLRMLCRSPGSEAK